MASSLILALVLAVLCGSGLAGRPMSQEECGCTELLHGFDKLKCWGNEIVATVPTLIDVPPGTPSSPPLRSTPWVADRANARAHVLRAPHWQFKNLFD